MHSAICSNLQKLVDMLSLCRRRYSCTCSGRYQDIKQTPNVNFANEWKEAKEREVTMGGGTREEMYPEREKDINLHISFCHDLQSSTEKNQN